VLGYRIVNDTSVILQWPVSFMICQYTTVLVSEKLFQHQHCFTSSWPGHAVLKKGTNFWKNKLYFYTDGFKLSLWWIYSTINCYLISCPLAHIFILLNCPFYFTWLTPLLQDDLSIELWSFTFLCEICVKQFHRLFSWGFCVND